MSVDNLILLPVKNVGERKVFARMTLDVYKDDKAFVQPLDFDVLSRLHPEKNPLLEQSDHQLWLVMRDGKPVGRIGAIINKAFIDHYKVKTGHFGYFEAIDDAQVIGLLFDTAESWLRDRGMETVAGPYNFSVNEECGLLIEGFERPPAVLMPHGQPYYQDYIEQRGFETASEMVAFWYPARKGFMPERRSKFIAKLVGKDHVEVRNFDFKNFQQEVVTAVEIFNNAWVDNWGFVPLSEVEARHMAADLRPIITRDNTVMCLVDGEPIAFGIVLPNINEIIKDLNGKLLPLNWIKFLWRLKVKGVTQARMPLMGIRKDYQGKPLGAAFAYKIIEMVNDSSVDNGIVNAELSWILKSNTAMMTMLEEIGGVADKTYRIYERPL